MGLLSTLLGGPVSAVVEGVTGIVKTGQQRRIARDAADAKLKIAKQEGQKEVTLVDAEWESVAAKSKQGTWVDEYITIVITAPLVLILAGGVYQAFTGDTRLMEGVTIGLEKLNILGVNMGELMYIVVLAGVGLKAWRGIKR